MRQMEGLCNIISEVAVDHSPSALSSQLIDWAVGSLESIQIECNHLKYLYIFCFKCMSIIYLLGNESLVATGGKKARAVDQGCRKLTISKSFGSNSTH